MPPSFLTAHVGFSKTKKIQNTLFEAKWPEEEIHANITEPDKENSSSRPTPVSECMCEKNCQVPNRKHTQLHSCGFCTPIFDRLGQILLTLLLNDDSEGISRTGGRKATGQEGERKGG